MSDDGVRVRDKIQRDQSFWSRWLCLALGTLWGLIGILVLLDLHTSSGAVTLNGVTTEPTVYGRDPTLWRLNFLAITAVVVAASVELAARTVRRSTRPGVIAIVLGGMLCAYSVLGFIFGVLAIAPIGTMLILSGRPVGANAASGTL